MKKSLLLNSNLRILCFYTAFRSCYRHQVGNLTLAELPSRQVCIVCGVECRRQPAAISIKTVKSNLQHCYQTAKQNYKT